MYYLYYKKIILLLLSLLSCNDAARADNDWSWDVTEKPPALSNPKIVDVTAIKPVHTAGWQRFLGVKSKGNPILCAGRIYRINLDKGQDAIVYMSGDKALKYPVHITGGRNVRVVGLHLELETQSGCDVGELPNIPPGKHPNANIHPRVPSAIALRLQQSGITFAEGLHIDVRGHEADCIVGRNPDAMTHAEARAQRDVIIQNTYCSGVEGLAKSDIGDGIHGDLFQNQGKDVMRRLVFENVTMRSSQEGIVLHRHDGNPGAKHLLIRRYDYSWDPRYASDDRYENFGLAFAGWPEAGKWRLEDVRIDDIRDGQDYLRINEQRYGNSPRGNVKPHEQIRSGLPAEGAFAPPERTGIHYDSPHGDPVTD